MQMCFYEVGDEDNQLRLYRILIILDFQKDVELKWKKVSLDRISSTCSVIIIIPHYTIRDPDKRVIGSSVNIIT